MEHQPERGTRRQHPCSTEHSTYQATLSLTNAGCPRPLFWTPCQPGSYTVAEIIQYCHNSAGTAINGQCHHSWFKFQELPRSSHSHIVIMATLRHNSDNTHKVAMFRTRRARAGVGVRGQELLVFGNHAHRTLQNHSRSGPVAPTTLHVLHALPLECKFAERSSQHSSGQHSSTEWVQDTISEGRVMRGPHSKRALQPHRGLLCAATAGIIRQCPAGELEIVVVENILGAISRRRKLLADPLETRCKN